MLNGRLTRVNGLSSDRYELVSDSSKIPIILNDINNHLKLSLITGTGKFYSCSFVSNEYDLDAIEQGDTNPTSYVASLRIRFIPSETNTGNATVKIFGLAAVPLKKQDGTNFASGELGTKTILTFEYDAVGVQFKQVGTLSSDEQLFDYYYYLCLAILKYIEGVTGRNFFNKTFNLHRNDFNFEIMLRRSPFNSLVTFKYLKGGSLVDVDPTTFQAVTMTDFSYITFNQDADYPYDQDEKHQNVEITFKSGYGTRIVDIPQDIKQCLLIILASLNQYRGDCIGSASVESFIITSNIPPQAQAIMQQYKIEEVY
jgi:hypothetical protein